ncbi:hypothetical protein MHYP_G00301570 [Metynnis hypsauchen]
MSRRCLITCVLVLLINEGENGEHFKSHWYLNAFDLPRLYLILFLSLCPLVLTPALEETVEAVEGRNVLLPCLYSGHIPKSEEVDVVWRYNDVKYVHDIAEGKVDADNQDPAFKNRTESFPDVYGKGNFSIRLSRVSGADSGTYSCLLTFASDTQYIKLQVKAPQRTPEPTPGSKNKSMESTSVQILLIFAILLGYNLVLF